MSKLVSLALFLIASFFWVSASADRKQFEAFKAALSLQDHSTAMSIAAGFKDKPNLQEPDGSTPLLWASYYESYKVVRFLLKAGANPNQENNFGAAPLLEVAKVGNEKLLKLLIKNSSDVNQSNAEGQNALMAVARNGNVKAAKLLIKNGARINDKESWGGQTALMWAASNQHPEMIRLLTKSGADVDARGTIRDWERRVTAEPRIKELHAGGLTPLLYASRVGCVACVKALVDSGADINLPSPEGVSPLITALLNLHFDTAFTLIELGANREQWDWWGRSPLYVAVDMNTLPQGGRPDLPSEDEHTGLDIIKLLLEKNVNPNVQLKLKPPLRHIVADRLADTMLSTGATPLLRAARAGDVEAINLLLKHGALADLASADKVTPLMAAAWKGGTRGKFKTEDRGLQAIKILLDAGADVNATDLRGKTALHGAARQAWNSVLQNMVARGANVNAVDVNGLSVHDYASGKADVVAFGVYDVVGVLPETAALLKSLGAK